ncbi:hypothetical protein GF358_02700 [Candidatus Woesearchaeota archaeon]|nr:hypothetical protein [Candidatus Woesearchaeota archaeon]
MPKYTKEDGAPDYCTALRHAVSFATEGSDELTQESAKVYLDALGLIAPDGSLLLTENKSIDDTL